MNGEYPIQISGLEITESPARRNAAVGITESELSNKYRLPPGPDRNSDEANFIINKKNIYKKMVERYIPEYGPIITLYKDDVPVIIVNDIEIGYELFVRKFSKEVSGRPVNYGEKLLSGNRNNILNSDYGPIWKVLQRTLHKGLRHCASLDRLDEIIFKCFEKFTESVDHKRGSENGGIEVIDDLFWMADNVITMLIFNEIFNDEEYHKYQAVLRMIPHYMDECEFLNDTPTKLSDYESVKNLEEAFTQLSMMLQKQIDDHRHRADYRIACLDITDFTLLGVEEYHLDPHVKTLGVKLTDLHVKHSLIDVIFASQEGLGNSFVWIVGLLALYPNIQDNIRSEMSRFRDDPSQPVTLHWKSKMPYTNAALCELQRFASADTFADFHSLMDDIVIGPYIIPKGSLINLNLYAIHHEKDKWKHPESIDPQNFLTDDGKSFRRRKDFVPYGLGLRTCVGNTFSENVLFLLLILLVDKYTLIWGENQKNEIIDDPNAILIRDVEPFKIQFVTLK